MLMDKDKRMPVVSYGKIDQSILRLNYFSEAAEAATPVPPHPQSERAEFPKWGNALFFCAHTISDFHSLLRVIICLQPFTSSWTKEGCLREIVVSLR